MSHSIRPRASPTLSAVLVDITPALLIAAGALVFYGDVGEFENYPKMLFLQCGIGVFALLRLLPSDDPPAWVPQWLDAAVVGFYVAAVLSVLQAVNPGLTALPLVHWGAGVLLYFALATTPRPRRSVGALFVGALVSSTLVSLIGLAQHHLALDWIPQAQPPAATFSNRNMAAHFVAMALPLGAGAIVLARSRFSRLVGTVALASSVGYLFVTRTRAAWLAVAAALSIGALAVFLWPRVARSNPGRRRWLTVSGVIALVLILGSLGVSHQLLKLDDPAMVRRASLSKVGTGTAQMRLVFWRNTLALAGDHLPFGVGLGNFKIHYPRYHRAAALDTTFDEEFQLERAHNDHLQLLSELGIAGWLFYAGMFVAFFRLVLVILRRPDRSELPLVLPLGSCVVSFVVIASFSFPTERALPSILVMTCFGLVAAQARGSASRRAKTLQSTGLRLLLAAAIVVTTSVAAYVTWRTMVTDRHASEARAALEQARVDEALADLDVARRYNLGNPDVPLLIAQAAAAQGRYEASLEALEEARSLHPNKINALLNLGFVNLQLGRPAEAEAFFRSALEIAPDSPTAHANLGLLAMQRQQYDEAIRRYRTVLDIAERRVPYGGMPRTAQHEFVAHVQLGRLLAARGERAAAVDHYRRALEIRPDAVEVRRLLDGLSRQNSSP